MVLQNIKFVWLQIMVVHFSIALTWNDLNFLIFWVRDLIVFAAKTWQIISILIYLWVICQKTFDIDPRYFTLKNSEGLEPASGKCTNLSNICFAALQFPEMPSENAKFTFLAKNNYKSRLELLLSYKMILTFGPIIRSGDKICVDNYT